MVLGKGVPRLLAESTFPSLEYWLQLLQFSSSNNDSDVPVTHVAPREVQHSVALRKALILNCILKSVNSDKHTCVCTTCGQGFTRRTSAIRHTNNLHSGQATIVKPYDYIIGRLRGDFSPGDPALYRRNRRNQTSSLVYNHHPQDRRNDTTVFGMQKDDWTHEPGSPNFKGLTDYQERPLYPAFGLPTSQSHQEPSYGSNKLLERASKLEELRRLLYKYCPSQLACQALAQVRQTMTLF
jgi:hypothetical protein